jgi:hypothetical protein
MFATRTILGLSETGFISLAGVVVAGLFGVLVEFVRRDNARTRQENHAQHNAGRETLEQVVGKLDVVHDDVRQVRDDVSKLRERHAVHDDRLDRLERPRPRPTVVDWNGPYDDEGDAA